MACLPRAIFDQLILEAFVGLRGAIGRGGSESRGGRIVQAHTHTVPSGQLPLAFLLFAESGEIRLGVVSMNTEKKHRFRIQDLNTPFLKAQPFI